MTFDDIEQVDPELAADGLSIMFYGHTPDDDQTFIWSIGLPIPITEGALLCRNGARWGGCTSRRAREERRVGEGTHLGGQAASCFDRNQQRDLFPAPGIEGMSALGGSIAVVFCSPAQSPKWTANDNFGVL